MAQPYEERVALEGELVPFRRPAGNPQGGIPYQPSVALRRPESLQPRPGGFLGLGINRQDQEHIDSTIKIDQIYVEIDQARVQGLALRVDGVRQAGQAANAINRLYQSHDPASPGGQLVADIGSRNLREIAEDDQLYADLYRTEITNVIQRKR